MLQRVAQAHWCHRTPMITLWIRPWLYLRILVWSSI
uniref:Uncharacterized protein n=1 Tax=Arundo donax TaxID=35708 RepID=A0A0A9EH82_ARUDO